MTEDTINLKTDMMVSVDGGLWVVKHVPHPPRRNFPNVPIEYQPCLMIGHINTSGELKMIENCPVTFLEIYEALMHRYNATEWPFRYWFFLCETAGHDEKTKEMYDGWQYKQVPGQGFPG